MKCICKLVFANIWLHPARLVFTALSVVAAACMVVWVVSGYDALLAQFDEFSSEYLGRYDLFVAPDTPNSAFRPGDPDGPTIPATLIAALRDDPAVAEVDPVVQSQITVETNDEKAGGPRRRPSGPAAGGRGPGQRGSSQRGPGQRVPGNREVGQGGLGQDGPGQNRRSALTPGPSPDAGEGRRARAANSTRPTNARSPQGGGRPLWRPNPTLEGTNATQPPYPMVEGQWIDPTKSELMQAAISSNTAEQLGIAVGDDLKVESKAGKFTLKIVGIVEQVSLRGGGPRMRFMALRGPATSALYVPIALAEKINGRPADASFVNIALTEGTNADEFRAKWSARLAELTPPAMLKACDDVGSELKEGRSAAGVRNQAYSATGIALLAALFIILTTLSMGVDERIRQFAVLRAVAFTRAKVATMIAVESLVLAAVGWLGGLAAGWALLRIASGVQPDLFRNGGTLGIWAIVLSGICAFGGALAAAILPAWRATRISPLDAMVPRPSFRPSRLSLVAVVLGFALIAVNPLLVYVIPMPDESRYGIYLAIGCTCMAVGFVLLAPLTIVATERILGPLVAKLLRTDGRLLSTQLTSNMWRTLGTTMALSLGLGLFVAIQTWGYSMLGPFVPGNWAPDVLVCLRMGGLPDAEIENVQQLKGVAPGQCIPLAVEQPKLAEDITGSKERNSVARQDNVIMIGLDPEKGLGGSDPLLKLDFVEGNRDEVVEKLKQGRYCVVPDHFLRATGLSIGDKFALLPVEGEEKPVEYTIAGAVTLPGWHWMTKFSGLRRRSGRSAAMVFAAYDDVRRDFRLDKTNFFWLNTDKSVPIDELGNSLEEIAQRHVGEKQPVNMQGTWAFAAQNFGSSVRITTPDQIRGRIGTRADSMIWGMSQLPLVTLAVTSLGMINAILASIRARRWEMGVLRSVGLTRFGLIRLILCEALLVGLVACLLSLAFGVMAGWCGAGISQYVSFFGGMDTPLIVPWSKLSMGLGAALLLCLAAALGPAVWTGRSQPLDLLQAGRAAM